MLCRSLTARALAGLACVLVFLPAPARPQRPAEAEPEYVIEIGGADGCMFAPVRRAAGRGDLMYTVPLSAAPRPAAGAPPASLVSFSAQLTGDVWKITVFVGRGEFFDAGGEQAAAFHARTGERVWVNAVTRFGLRPFRVGVVNVLGERARPPRFVNDTRSVATDKVEANVLPEPYRVFLRNTSDRDVMAVEYHTYKRGELMFLKWLEAGPDEPLIKPGGVYRLDVLSEDHSCAGDEGYRPMQSDRIALVSAVFADGTYEGAPGLAAMIRGDAIGNRKHLSRIVEALGELAGREVVTAGEVVYQLNQLASVLDEAADSNLLNELQVGFPMLGADATPTLAGYLRHGQHEVRKQLLADVARLEQSAGKVGDEASVAKWLSQTKVRYERWLAVAEKLSAR